MSIIGAPWVAASTSRTTLARWAEGGALGPGPGPAAAETAHAAGRGGDAVAHAAWSARWCVTGASGAVAVTAVAVTAASEWSVSDAAAAARSVSAVAVASVTSVHLKVREKGGRGFSTSQVGGAGVFLCCVVLTC